MWNVFITGVNTAEVTLGENLKVNFMLTKHEQIDITYLVRVVCIYVFVHMLHVCVYFSSWCTHVA